MAGGRGIDWSAFAGNMARPGMDPRVWVSLAVVQKFIVHPSEGCFADIILMPSEVQEIARVGAVYAGDGFGLYAPLQFEDEVLVCAPSGDPNEGLVVMQRLWSPSDPPPADAIRENPNDLILVVKGDRNFRVLTSGTGNVFIEPRGEGKVQLGSSDDAATDFVALAAKVLADFNALKTRFEILEAAFTATPAITPATAVVAVAALQGAIATNPYPTPDPVAAEKVKAK